MPTEPVADQLAHIDDLRRRSRFEAAEDALHTAVRSAVDPIAAEIAWGRLDLCRDRDEAALVHFTKATSIDPPSEVATAWRIGTLSRLYRYDEATTLAVDSQSEFPGSPQIGVTLGRVYLDQGRVTDALAQFESVLDHHADYEPALRWRVVALGELHRYALAEDAAQAVAERWPKSPRIAVPLADIFEAEGRYDDAINWIERALHIDPDYIGALKGQIRVLREACRYSDCDVAAEQAIRRLPETAALYVEWALLRRDEGRYTDALELLDQALTIQPDHHGALEWRITTLTDLYRYKDAEKAASEALSHHPRSPDILDSLAWNHQAQGHSAEAIKALNRAIEIDNYHLPSIDGRATVLRHMRRYGEAGEYLADAVKRFPHSARLHLEWGLLEDAQGRPIEALKKIEQALEINPYNRLALQWRVKVLREQNRYAEAMESAQAAIERVPSSGLWVQYGYIYEDEEKHNEAAAAFQRALDIDPANPSAHRSMISALSSLNQFADAETAARIAIEQLPYSVELRQQLGWIYSDQDLDERALAEFRHAAELDSGNPTGPERIAQALRWLHRYADAEEVLLEAIRNWPDEPRLHSGLGWCLSDQARDDEALVEFERVSELDPADTDSISWRIYVLNSVLRYSEAEDLAREAVIQHPDVDGLWTQLIFSYYRQGRFNEVEEAARRALQLNPASRNLAIYIASIYNFLGREIEALSLVMRVLDEEGSNSSALALQVELLDDLQRYPEAERACLAAMTTHPSSPDFVVQLGELQSTQGRYADALTTFQRAAEIVPSRQVRYAQAANLRRLGRYVEAANLLRAEIEQRPNYTDSYVGLCEVLHEQGRCGEALAAAERSIQVDAFDPDARVTLIAALRCVGRLEDASSAAREASQLMPNKAGLILACGQTHDARHEYSKALACFDRSLELAPLYVGARTAKSATLRSLRRFDEAELVLRPAIERFPRFKQPRIELGWVYRDQGRLTQSARIFTQLRDEAINGADRADAFNGLGWVAFTSDDYAAAEQFFRQGLAADPFSHSNKLGLAWSLARRDESAQWNEAERLCHEVLDTRPRSLVAHTCLGVLYFRRTNYPAAEHHLRQTIELDPYNGSYVDLGAFYVQLARYDEAEKALATALAHDWYDVQAHIELGSMLLRKDLDDVTANTGAGKAVQHFRQALAINPASGSAAIGLALALSRSQGDLLGAEGVLRDALSLGGEADARSQLLLALARTVIERADATQRDELYVEALALAQGAIELAATEPEPYFVAGVAAYKTGENINQVSARPFYRRRTVKYLQQCLSQDPDNAEARRTMLLAQESLKVTRSSLAGSAALGVLATTLLAILWSAFFFSDRVTSLMLTTLTPILAGLVALGFVLPFLIRLKLPGGVEADLSASLHQVSAGPTGDMSVGPGRIGNRFGDSLRTPTLNPGPRGHLPRLD